MIDGWMSGRLMETSITKSWLVLPHLLGECGLQLSVGDTTSTYGTVHLAESSYQGVFSTPQYLYICKVQVNAIALIL